MTWDEVRGEVDNTLWFEVYSRALQRVGEAVRSQRWQWLKGKVREVAVSPIVKAFWEETGMEPTTSCTRLCWKLQLRAMFRRRERGTVSHVITFLDDMAVCTPMLDAWDQFVWLPSAAVPWTTMQAEQYGYCCGNAINLGAVMLVTEFRVTDEEGIYPCMVRSPEFEGSILAYDPTRDKAEWVPAHGVANDLSWVEERMAVTLANFVPRTGQEADHIAKLRTHRLLAWTDESSSEDQGKEMQEEDDAHEQTQAGDDECIPRPLLEDNEHEEVEGWGESNLEALPGNETCGLGEAEPEMEP